VDSMEREGEMIYFITSLSVFIVAAVFVVAAIVANGYKLNVIIEQLEHVNDGGLG